MADRKPFNQHLKRLLGFLQKYIIIHILALFPYLNYLAGFNYYFYIYLLFNHNNQPNNIIFSVANLIQQTN